MKITADEMTALGRLYREFHRHPELSMQEHRTQERIEAELDRLGIEHFRCGGTGVVGRIDNGEGPVIAFRADTDGLPIPEDTGLEYSSTARGTLPDGTEVPVMHGCGHDTHIASLLGTAAVLLREREAWSGTLVLIFQPGEETAAGAAAMISDGLWDRAPRPEVVLGQHVMPRRVGTAAVSLDAAMAQADSWRIILHGRQSHGSQPQDSVDPVLLGAAVVQRLQGIVSREISPLENAVVTVGTFHAGLKENIIPDRAEITVNVRTLEAGVRDRVLKAIRRIVLAEAQASGAPEPEIEELYRFPVNRNDPAAAERVLEALRRELGQEEAEVSPPLMGSEDFGLLGSAIDVPTVFWFFGGFAPGRQEVPVNHSPYFGPEAEGTLDTGVRAALATIAAWLGR